MFKLTIYSTLIGLSALQSTSACERKHPNILLISVDDMNDWVGCLNGHPQTKTPAIDRLAKDGLLFRNAHITSPLCNPSRTATLLGKMPSTTGVYTNSHWWIPLQPKSTSLFHHFRNNGYKVAGGGKVFHHTPGFNDPNGWDEYYHWDDRARKRGWFDDYHFPTWPGVDKKPNTIVAKKTKLNFDWAVSTTPDEKTPDGKVATWASSFLQKKHDKPFLLSVGIFRPHIEWYTGQKYFDMHPLKNIKLPAYREDDLNDVPTIGRKWATNKASNHSFIKSNNYWHQAVQAYLACISFADAQVGRVLDALEKSPHADNTIVVFWSDHGYHLGEKEHWHKFTLWQRSTRVPFIIKLPNKQQGSTDLPASMIDLYPTLCELAKIKSPKDLDGKSIVNIINNPDQATNTPAIIEYGKGNYAVNDGKWHYIRYANGSEELYDRINDPNEFTNLASKPEFAKIMVKLSKCHDGKWAPAAPSKNAYRFDPKAYTWERK